MMAAQPILPGSIRSRDLVHAGVRYRAHRRGLQRRTAPLDSRQPVTGNHARVRPSRHPGVEGRLIHGLPRSEETHSPNGMILSADGTKRSQAQGGNTEHGAPSQYFSNIAAPILSPRVVPRVLSSPSAATTWRPHRFSPSGWTRVRSASTGALARPQPRSRGTGSRVVPETDDPADPRQPCHPRRRCGGRRRYRSILGEPDPPA